MKGLRVPKAYVILSLVVGGLGEIFFGAYAYVLYAQFGASKSNAVQIFLPAFFLVGGLFFMRDLRSVYRIDCLPNHVLRCKGVIGETMLSIESIKSIQSFNPYRFSISHSKGTLRCFSWFGFQDFVDGIKSINPDIKVY